MVGVATSLCTLYYLQALCLSNSGSFTAVRTAWSYGAPYGSMNLAGLDIWHAVACIQGDPFSSKQSVQRPRRKQGHAINNVNTTNAGAFRNQAAQTRTAPTTTYICYCCTKTRVYYSAAACDPTGRQWISPAVGIVAGRALSCVRCGSGAAVCRPNLNLYSYSSKLYTRLVGVLSSGRAAFSPFFPLPPTAAKKAAVAQ